MIPVVPDCQPQCGRGRLWSSILHPAPLAPALLASLGLVEGRLEQPAFAVRAGSGTLGAWGFLVLHCSSSLRFAVWGLAACVVCCLCWGCCCCCHAQLGLCGIKTAMHAAGYEHCCRRHAWFSGSVCAGTTELSWLVPESRLSKSHACKGAAGHHTYTKL